MYLRKSTLALAAVCASLLLVPAVAGAQTSGTAVHSLQQVPISGMAQNHKRFTGHFSVDRFVSRHGKTFAFGTLTGRLGHNSVKRSGVAMPAGVGNGLTGTAQARAAASCAVLHLVLGPVNLNLLGLVVHLGGGAAANQPIVLDITAQQGSGNLLGNLLCSVANLLNGTGTTPLTSSPTSGLTAGLLNLVNSLLGTPALGSL
jgi:hypothetical protein